MNKVTESVEPIINTEVMMVARKSRLNLIKEYQENIQKLIRAKFLKSKKLPANTPQKYGQTMRIGFQRR